MKKNSKKLKITITLILVLSTAITYSLKYTPNWIKENYNNKIYPYLLSKHSQIWSKTTISIGDIIYGTCVMYLIYLMYLGMKVIVKYNRSIFRRIKIGDAITKVSHIAMLIYCLFTWNWGFHYNQDALSERLKISSHRKKPEKLFEYTEYILDEVNKKHLELLEIQQKNKTTQDSIETIKISYTDQEIFEKSTQAYRNLPKELKNYFLKDIQPIPRLAVKKSLISYVLTYMGFSGYLNPFTLEAQINSRLPQFKKITTSCHEIAHQLGYAKEKDANFLAVISSTNSTDPYFQYNGLCFALKYCLLDIKRNHPEYYDCIYPKIHKGILKQYKEHYLFWKEHHTNIEVLFKKFYDTFLKINHQKSGIKSYSQITQLLLHYHYYPESFK